MTHDTILQNWVDFRIECYKKRGDDFVGEIKLPGGKRHIQRYRKLLGKKRNETMDGVRIDKRLKMKLEARYPVKINIRKYDCFFAEYTKEGFFDFCSKKSKKNRCVYSPRVPVRSRSRKKQRPEMVKTKKRK